MRRQNNQSPRCNSPNGQNDLYYSNSRKLNVVETCTIENDCCCKCGGKKQQQQQQQQQQRQQLRHSNLQGENTQIDDDTLRALLSLRQKACQFINSETEHTTTTESVPHSNKSCPCQNQFKDEKYLIRIEDLLEYSPQSQFLKKLKRHFQGYPYDQCTPNIFNERNIVPTSEEVTKSQCNEDSKGVGDLPTKKSEKECKCCMCNQKDKLQEKTPKSRQGQSEKLKSRASSDRKNKRSQEKKEDTHQDEYSAKNITYRKSPKKSQHVSRPRKLVKHRSRRKKRSEESGDKQSSQEYFEPSLKRPHEDSCERCWRYASTSRSPVNKPDQRYNPNFRRAHSWQDFSTVKESASEFYSSEKLDKNTGPIKRQEELTKDFDFPSAQKPHPLNNYTTSRIKELEVQKSPQRGSAKNYQSSEEVKKQQTPQKQLESFSHKERKPRPKSYTPGVSPRNLDREMSTFFENLDCTEYKEIQTKKSSPKEMSSTRSMKSSQNANTKIPVEQSGKENEYRKTKTKTSSPKRKRDVKSGKQLPEGTTEGVGQSNWVKQKQRLNKDAEWIPGTRGPQDGSGKAYPPPRIPPGDAEWIPGTRKPHGGPRNDFPPSRIPPDDAEWIPGVRGPHGGSGNDYPPPRLPPDDAEWIPGTRGPHDGSGNDYPPPVFCDDAEWIPGTRGPHSNFGNNYPPPRAPPNNAEWIPRAKVPHSNFGNNYPPPRAPPKDAGWMPGARIPHDNPRYDYSPSRIAPKDTEWIPCPAMPHDNFRNDYSSPRVTPKNAEWIPRSDFVSVDFNKSSIGLPNPPHPQSNMYIDTTRTLHSKSATNKSSSRYLDSSRTQNMHTQRSASPKNMNNNQMPVSDRHYSNEVSYIPKSQSTHAFQNKYLPLQQRPRTVDHSDPRYTPKIVPNQEMRSGVEYQTRSPSHAYPPHEMRPCLCRQDKPKQRTAQEKSRNYSSDREPKKKEYCCHCRRKDSPPRNNYKQNDPYIEDHTYNEVQPRSGQTKEFEKMHPKYYAVNSCRCTEWQEPMTYTTPGGEKGKIVLCPYNEVCPEKCHAPQESAYPDTEKYYDRANQNYPVCPELEHRNATGRRGQSNFTNYVPTNYCVFYMKKNEQNKEDEVEVLVEELTEKPIGRTKKDCRTQAIEDKMRKILESRSRSESMALRFQKGLSEVASDPKSIRTLYF